MTKATKERTWKGSPDLEKHLIPLDKLHSDPDNENEHSSDQIQRMTISLAEHGQEESITVDPWPDKGAGHFKIVSGALRVMAAEILAWSHFAGVRYGGDPKKAPAYRVIANKIPQMSRLDGAAVDRTANLLAKDFPKDFDGGMIGYTKAELDTLHAKVLAEAKETDVPTVDVPDVPETRAPGAPPGADRTTVLEFDNPQQREAFVAFLALLGVSRPDLPTIGSRLEWYISTSGSGEPGFSGDRYIFQFHNPDEKNRFAKLIQQLEATYGGKAGPDGDLRRFVTWLDDPGA